VLAHAPSPGSGCNGAAKGNTLTTRDHNLVHLKGNDTMTDATPAPAAPLNESDDKLYAGLSHILGIFGFLPSLIIFLVFKDRGARTAVESKEALNFQITATAAQIALIIVNTILTAITFGLWALISWIFHLAVFVLVVIFSIQGFQKVNAGGSYRYPFAIRLIK
jgi:uncharacterized protein